eukprot:6192732-Pleurochrysis_carterae.AAC.2
MGCMLADARAHSTGLETLCRIRSALPAHIRMQACADAQARRAPACACSHLSVHARPLARVASGGRPVRSVRPAVSTS